jgi:hypothetical protein
MPILEGKEAIKFLDKMKRKTCLTKKDKRIIKEMKKVDSWLIKNEASMKKGVPICPLCLRPMQPAYDSIAKKITGYQWKCDCNPKIRLSVG